MKRDNSAQSWENTDWGGEKSHSYVINYYGPSITHSSQEDRDHLGYSYRVYMGVPQSREPSLQN